MAQYKGVFASSTDPSGQTPSMTIMSGVQMLIGLVATLAVVKGVDPVLVSQNATTLSDSLNNLVAQGLAIVTAGYSAYHSMQMIAGLVRKWFPKVPELPDLPGEQQ